MAESDKDLKVETSVPTPLTNDENKTGIIVAITFLVLLLVIIIIWLYTKYSHDKNYYKKTVFFRFEEFSKLSVSKFTLTLVMAYLVAAIVNGFNKSMMIPIVQSLFPSEDLWGQGVSLTRGAVMYPGLFFLYVVSFFMSLLFIFIIAEIIYQVFSLLTKNGEATTKKVGIFILIGLLIALMSWNIYDLETNKESPSTKTIPPIMSSMGGGRVMMTPTTAGSSNYARLLGMSIF